jgi:hypothetical protein
MVKKPIGVAGGGAACAAAVATVGALPHTVGAMLPRASLLIVLTTAVFAACDWANGSNSSDGPMDQPKFLTPVAEAQEAGVEIWWLGPEFQADGLPLGISGVAQFEGDDPGSGLGLQYSGDRGEGINVWSYSKEGGGVSKWREPALRSDESGPEPVTVGAWNAELFSLPGPGRPVNDVLLFVDVGDTIVVLDAASGSTGIPKTDVNPLIGEELLLRLVTEELRPYPE